MIIIEVLPVSVFAFTDTCSQSPPQRVRVEAGSGQMEPPIGYNDFDGYYVDIKFDVEFPSNPEQPVVGGFLNFYSQPVNKPYNFNQGTTAVEKDVPVPAGGMTQRRMKGFSSGTIYYIDVSAYHTHRNENGEIVKSIESVRQPIKLKVLTDIEIEAHTQGSNEIKIVWDDVWDVNRRISYRIYISETDNFANTPPVYISQNEIGPSKPVVVNEATGKLEYIHKVRDPGRVYYVKIVPDIADGEIKKSPETAVVKASSYILVKTTKMSSTSDGTMWRLDWSPVVTGLGDRNIKVNYQIYRGLQNTTDTPQYLASVSGTTFFVNQPIGSEDYYYIIRAFVTKDGAEVYPDVRIISDRIIVREDDIAAKPPVPEIVDGFERAPGDYIIKYSDNLTPTSAVILWRAPLTSNGTPDSKVTYDIWMVSNPSIIDNPPQGAKIASNISMTQYNQVTSEAKVVGYKYGLLNLSPNTAYYVKIVAKKVFLDYVDGKLEEVTYESDPSIKIVITPAEGDISTPLIPARPPFKVKQDRNGMYMIDSDSAVVQVKNRWYEKFDASLDMWEFVETTKESENDVPLYDPIAQPPDNIQYRAVEYDEGVKLDVGCVKYVAGMTQDDIRTIIATFEPQKLIGVPLVTNDPWEDSRLNAPIQTNPNVYKKHNVDIKIDNLEPNTSYIVWVRAVKRRSDIVSGPSEPVIITTDPQITVPGEKPVIPVFSYGYAGDTYIDISWNYRPGYVYNIKYTTVDDINAAGESITLSYEEIRYKGYYRLEGLLPETIYYFFIQAESKNISGENMLSDWSDSLVVKTLEYLPPLVPLGFGLKNTDDALTQNTITFEWLKLDKMGYLLEIADNPDYFNPIRVSMLDVSEYTVVDLTSNTRYYARLCAYDTVRDLYSEPTQSIILRTKRSYDDYDSDKDTDEVFKGDFIVKGEYPIDGVWTVEIIGVNADRFIENIRMDGKLDYLLELSNMPEGTKEISLALSHRILKALPALKENIIIRTAFGDLILKEGVFDTSFDKYVSSRYAEYDYVLSLGSGGYGSGSGSSSISRSSTVHENIEFLGDMINLDFCVKLEGAIIPVDYIGLPMEFRMHFGNYHDKSPAEFLFIKKGSDDWQGIPHVEGFDSYGNIYREVKIFEPGKVVLAKRSQKPAHVDILGHPYESSIKNITSQFTLFGASSKYFRPNDNISAEEAIKFSMDILDYNYSHDYMNTAVRAGLIDNPLVAEGNLSRQQAIFMTVRIYELIKGIKITNYQSDDIFTDMEKVSPVFLDKVRYAIDNGVLFSVTGDELKPHENVTRAEFVALLEKILALSGKI